MVHEEIWNSIELAVSNKEKYNLLLKWVVMSRAFPTGDADANRIKIIEGHLDKLYNWLDAFGFYTAPASTRYHESYVGGLLDHTINVVYRIIELHELPKFSKVNLASAILVALTHDWCKIGFYESYLKNTKDAQGNWVKETAFKCAESPLTALGHGVSSMYLASKWFTLSEEEALAIRWHMGMWRTVDSECSELQYANENFPLVHMLQFADQLSLVKY